MLPIIKRLAYKEFKWPIVLRSTLLNEKGQAEKRYKDIRRSHEKEIEEEREKTSAIMKTVQKIEPRHANRDDTLILNLAISEPFLRQAVQYGENDRHFWEAIADRMCWQMRRGDDRHVALGLSSLRYAN